VDKTTREIKEKNDNDEWRYQRPISSGSIERYPDVAVVLWNIGTVMPGGDALLLYHSDGTIWGCPDQPERYDEGLLTARNATLQRIITMWFVSPLVAGIITYAALVAVG